MDPKIKALKSKTFFGRRLTRQQIADIQETVALLPNDSRNELCKTICEHLNWKTAKGDYRVRACMAMLEYLEQRGILKLPSVAESKRPSCDAKPIQTAATNPQPEISATAAELGTLRLEPVDDRGQKQLWNAFIDRHHYIGYNRPFGPHLRYFLVDGQGRKLGCLLFESCTKALPCRDQWVGWHPKTRDRTRHLLLNNSRFLIFPWVRSRNLASRCLAMATRRLAGDWEERHGVRPVLVETFVDLEKYRASCYRAANWNFIGETAGMKGKSKKSVYVIPLVENCLEVLRGERKAKARPTVPPKPPSEARDERFRRLWVNIAKSAAAVASLHDHMWQKRRRVLDSLLIILFVFRLILSKERIGYAATLRSLWDQCLHLGIPLPQPHPPTASSINGAREKLDEAAFISLHREFLAQFGAMPEPLWKGKRIFAVNSSKINLPRPLANASYMISNEGANYPQGTVSVLYRLKTAVPVDFDLFRHADARDTAVSHLVHVGEGDVVVYDLGHYSFELLLDHRERGLNCVFMIHENSDSAFDTFFASDRTDIVLDLAAPKERLRLNENSCRVRLVKYTFADTRYCLATTLLDERKYEVPAFSELYHGNRSIEELSKVSNYLGKEFHGMSERCVKQELYATLTLIAIDRIYANRCLEDENRASRQAAA